MALAGYYPSTVEPYLFYKCLFRAGCAGGGGGLISRAAANQNYQQLHPNVSFTVLPTAAGSLTEPTRCLVGKFEATNRSTAIYSVMACGRRRV